MVDSRREELVMPPPKIIGVTLDASVGIDPILTGAGGIVRGPTITVKGSAACLKRTFTENAPNPPKVQAPGAISEVAVRLGPSGAFVKARPTGTGSGAQQSWTTWITDPLPITGVVNDKLEITARVSASVDNPVVGEGEEPVRAEAKATSSVTVDRTPPSLSLSTQDGITAPIVNGQATFQLAG